MIGVRPATLADARRFAEIHVAAWNAVYRGVMPDTLIDGRTVETRQAQWTQQLAERPGFGLVAEDHGWVVGWCTLGPAEHAVGRGEVYAIYLDPAVRRRGIGRRLWQAAAATLARRGLSPFCVSSLSANVDARRFYEAMGGRLDPDGPAAFTRGDVRLPQVRYWFGVPADTVPIASGESL